MAVEYNYKTYRVTKNAAANGLGVTDVQEWRWVGSGIDIVHSATFVQNPQLPPAVDTRVVPHTYYPFTEIRSLFFSNIPEDRFVRISMSQDSTYLWFDLNLKEQ